MAVLSRRGVAIQQGVVVGAGVPLVGQEYFGIYDQSGRLWYWWISYDLAAEWGLAPESSYDQEIVLYRIPWWLVLADSDSFLWYVYPDLDGAPIVETSAPPNGVEIRNSPKLRVKDGKTKYQYTIVGGDLDVSAV